MNIQDTIDKILNDLPKRATKRDIEIARVKISLLFEEKVVLQKVKWRELLKLLQTKPNLEMYPLDALKDSYVRSVFHSRVQEYFRKIESKLEEIGK